MNLALSLRHFFKRWGLPFPGLLSPKTDCSLSTNLIGHLPTNGTFDVVVALVVVGTFVVVGGRVVVRVAKTVVGGHLPVTVVGASLPVTVVGGAVCSLDTVVGASHGLYLVVSGHVPVTVVGAYVIGSYVV